jgi:hypothetical protein
VSKTIATRWQAEQAVRFIQRLRERLEVVAGDDEQAIRDTIEGETDVDPVMEKLISLRQEAKAMAAARKELSQRYAEASKENERQAEHLELIILDCLQASGIEKWAGPAGTASIRQGSMSCYVTDATHVPLQYMKAVPDISKIKADILAGKEVPGAEVIRGEDTLAIRLPGKKKGEE